jgi:hypothetical protein
MPLLDAIGIPRRTQQNRYLVECNSLVRQGQHATDNLDAFTLSPGAEKTTTCSSRCAWAQPSSLKMSR